LGSKAKGIGRAREPKEACVDFTVVSIWLEGIILVGVVIALGIAKAVLESL
jgi:hypothetical protein